MFCLTIMHRMSATKNLTSFDRIIGKIGGNKPGPTLLFVAGMHGNEPSGVYALQKVIDQMQSLNSHFKGKMIAITGNIGALKEGVRYKDIDLNRQFTKEKISAMKGRNNEDYHETQEQIELYNTIETILNSEPGPFYFFDLHTTSAETIPFLTVNDSLLNRKFTNQYPLPIVLGIEEYLDGPLLSYINELGYVAFGFEAGQHNAASSFKNHVAFVMLSLVYSGCLSAEQILFKKYYQQLSLAVHNNYNFFEIIYRHEVLPSSHFKMKLGYLNFQSIRKKETLAQQDETIVRAPLSGRIFMPLYQGKGEDGFFIIRKIPFIFLWISKWVRTIQLDRILALLPGIYWKDTKKQELLVNRNVARFLAKEIFHLLGYRSKRWDKTHFLMKNRERASQKSAYGNQSWN